MSLHPGTLAYLAFRQNLELNLVAPCDLCEDGNSRIAVRVIEANLQLNIERAVGAIIAKLTVALLLVETNEAPFDSVAPHPGDGDDATKGLGVLAGDAADVPALAIRDSDGVAVDGIVLQDEAEGIATLQISQINRRRLLVAAGEGEDASDGRHGGSKRRSRRAG